MKYKILHLIDGAKEARGLTVVIDVFRAFSTAVYLFANGVEKVIPVGKLETAYQLKKENSDWVLMGERDGKKLKAFDYGNSPYLIKDINFKGKTVIHTSTNGTQGIANARNADEIITGSFVNAQAIANYIRVKKPKNLSLVCMGNDNLDIAREDLLCAKYIVSFLDNNNNLAKDSIIADLKASSGKRFFDPKNRNWAPEADFQLCLDFNRFNFILKAEPYQEGLNCLFKVSI
ncbi:2-phosphosulfolactate phosphatase [Natronospora cellulosivora (SeqCode)]